MGRREWQTPATYPHGRVAEFAMTVRAEMLVSNNDVIGYVTESEHQEGANWLDRYEFLSDLIQDFKLYLDADG